MFQNLSSNKYPKNVSKDDSNVISNRKLINIIKIEKRLEREKTPYSKRKKNFGIFIEVKMNDKIKNELNDKDSLDDTDHSTKSGKNNIKITKPLNRNTSHSCNSLINMGEIEGPIEEPKRNISDDESEKMNMNLNKANKKFMEKLTPFKNEIITEENREENDFLLKTYIKSDNIRKVYYSQLLLKRVWIPLNDSQRHNNLIIFDWDDTLLPTSFLLYKDAIDNENKLNEKDKSKIYKLEQLVKNLLTLSLSKGDVYIITNAGEGWVEDSAKKFYPDIKEILDKIEVISARKDYEQKYPNDTKLWKIGAFLNLKNRLNEDLITNILCLGDSVFEMDAGKILAGHFIHAVIKTIKFMENPKPEELNKQLNLVLNQFNSIFNSYKNLTVRVEKKKK